MPLKTSRPAVSLAVLISLTLLLSGCAAAEAASPRSASSSAPAAPTATPAPSAPAAPQSTPPPAAQMICADETQGNVAKIFSIAQPTKPVSHWSNDLFTCTYRLPTGTLQLSVKQSSDPTAARAYFAQQRRTAVNPEDIQGLANLGLPAYQTEDGEVSFVKDNMTLLVDGSQLSAPTTGDASRTHLAYQVATAILGCWSE